MNGIIERIESVAAELVATLKRKNADYGDSFANLYTKIGMPYAYGHIAEKTERIWTLMNNDAQVNESIVDSLYDLAGYALLTLATIKGDDAQENVEQPIVKREYFTEENKAKFKVGDVIRRIGDFTDKAWYVKTVTSAYILIANGESRALIHPYEQGSWEHYAPKFTS